MSANRINGFFNTLNVVNDKGRIRLDDDGNIRLVGTNYFLSISEKLQISSSGKLNLTSTNDDIIIDSQIGSVKIQAGAEGQTAILITNQNPNGGILIESGLSGTDLISTGDINIKSTGNDIYIGYADNDFGLTGIDETHNVFIEANDTISGNAKYIQFVASDVISLIAPEINFGTSPSNPFIRIVDDCLLIDSIEPNGIRKVLIDTNNDSLSKPGYDGLLIRSRNNNISTDITVQTSDLNTYNLPISDLSFGVESLNTTNKQTSVEQFIAYKSDSKIVSIDYPRDFTTNDIGKTIYWVSNDISDKIIDVVGYISQPSISTTSPTPPSPSPSSILITSGNYSGNTRKYYKIQIQTPNKFRWSNDEGLNYQEELIDIIVDTPILLEDNISITFTVDTGFDLNTEWTFFAIPTVITEGITSNITEMDLQTVKILQPGLSYVSNKERQDLILQTSGQERLRITDNGNVSIGQSNPTATFEVYNKVNKRLLLSTNYIGQQINPSVVCLSNGGWVAVWESYTDIDNQYDIYGQIFYPDGTRNGNQFIINTETLNNQSSPSVAANQEPESERFIVVWSSEEPSNPGQYNIQSRIYDAEHIDGSRAITTEFTINTTILYNQKYPRVVGLKKSNNQYNYVVVWSSNQSDGVNVDSYFQIINTNGSLIGDNTIVNTTTSLRQTYPAVSYIDVNDSNIPGGFVIAYISEHSDNFFDIRYQLFNSNGNMYGSETLITSDNQKSYGRVSVQGLYNGDFIITFNESYYGDNSNFVYDPPGSRDTITGSTSFTQGILSGVNPSTPTIIQVTINVGDKFLIGEEIITSLSNRTEKIKNIRIISPTILEIELSRDTKVIKAVRYNTNNTLVYSINSVNTTPLDLSLNNTNLEIPIDWTINYTTESSYYTLPTIAETYDKNFIITWANIFDYTIYYQKFNMINGSKLGDEMVLNKQVLGNKERNPVIAKLVNKYNQDAGFVIVYSSETFDSSYQGVFGQLINDDNCLMKVWNQNGNMNFTNQGMLGIGTDNNSPDSLLHLKSSNPDITLQSTDSTIGNSNANSKIIFKDSYNNKLAEIVGCYTTSYQSRNPKFSNLIRWFQFDESDGSNFISDSSQSNIQGRLYNFDIFSDWSNGKIKKALRFRGEQYIDCGFNNDLILNYNSGLSISTWVKAFEGGSDGITSTIISSGDITPGHFNLKINNNSRLLGTMYTNTGPKTITGSSLISDGEWHNLVFIYDNNEDNVSLYVDGIIDTGITGITGDNMLSTPSQNLIIGSFNGDEQFLSGYLDDLRIYNTVLNGNDVSELYNNIVQTKGKIVLRTNDGVQMPDDNSVKNFTIDSDGYVESYRSRSLPDSTLSGIVIPTNNKLNGTNTKFTSEINIGDEIIINDVSRIVIEIINDTDLTVNKTYTGDLPVSSFENVIRKPSLFTTLDNSENVRTVITSAGKMSIGYPDPSAKLVISGINSYGEYADLHLNNLTNITTGEPQGGISQIIFNGSDELGQKFKILSFESQASLNGGLYDGLLKVSLVNQSSDNQVMILNNQGYLGLNNQLNFNPEANLHIIDNDTSDVNILLESGSDYQEILGGKSNIIFKSKNITDSYGKVSGSSDSTLSNSSKGRLDFYTNNGSENIDRLILKSDNKVSFHLPEPINDFQISPLETNSSSGQSVSLTGTTVNGVGTAFTDSYIGNIIYFKTSKVSKLIVSVTDANTLTVSESDTLPSQDYAIYNPGFNITNDLKFGLGLVNPSSDFHTKGTLATDVNIITYSDCDDFTLISGLYYVGVHPPNTVDNHPVSTLLVDTSDGIITIRLPPSYSCPGRIYNIKRVIGPLNDVIIDGFSDGITSELIDYISQITLDAVYKSISIQSDGISKWNVLSLSSSSGTETIPNTDALAEGIVNLYYTDNRVLTVIDNINTNYLAEGPSNLYFTEERVNTLTAPLYDAINTLSISFDPVGAAAAAESNTITYINNLTSDNITPGLTNLYCTSANVVDAIYSAIGITANNVSIIGDLYRTIGTTVQPTSQTTSITLNNTNGIITTYNISLNVSEALSFVVNNNKVSSGDQVFATVTGKTTDPAPDYLFPIVSIYNITNGSFNIVLRNPHPINVCSGEFNISFQVIKHL